MGEEAGARGDDDGWRQRAREGAGPTSAVHGGTEEAGAEDGGAEGLGRRARRGPDGGGGVGDGRRPASIDLVEGEWRRTLSPPDYIEEAV